MSSRERADLGFDDALEDFDPAEWSPAPRPARSRPAAEETRQAAEKLGFRSREAKVIQGSESAPMSAPHGGVGGHVQRRRRTGRNAQLNLKAKPETIAAYTAIADAQGWGLGETLERAVELLERTYGKG